MPSIWSPIAHLEHFKRDNRKLNDLYEQFHAANVQSLQLMRMGMGFTQHMAASRVSDWKQTLEQLGFDEGNVMTLTLLWSQGLPGRSLCNLLLTIWLRDDRLQNLKYQFAPHEYQRMMRQARRLVDMPPKKHKDMPFWSPPDALNGDLWIQQHFSPNMVHIVGHPSTWNTPANQRLVKWANWLKTREPLGSAPRNAPPEDYHKPQGMTYGPHAHPPPPPQWRTSTNCGNCIASTWTGTSSESTSAERTWRRTGTRTTTRTTRQRRCTATSSAPRTTTWQSSCADNGNYQVQGPFQTSSTEIAAVVPGFGGTCHDTREDGDVPGEGNRVCREVRGPSRSLWPADAAAAQAA